MRDLELVIKIRNMNEMILKLRAVCSNFGKYLLERHHSDIYFSTNCAHNLIIRKYNDNTGELILFDEFCKDNIIERRVDKIGLSEDMIDDFINIFSQANGQIRTIQVKRKMYLHFFNTYTAMIDKIDDLGNFLVIQAMLSEEDMLYHIDDIIIQFKCILNDLEIHQDDIVKKPFIKLITEANE